MDDIKIYCKIKYIFGVNYYDKVGCFLVSEFYIVGEGGWFGFFFYKYDIDWLFDEICYDEIYNYWFKLNYGIGV